MDDSKSLLRGDKLSAEVIELSRGYRYAYAITITFPHNSNIKRRTYDITRVAGGILNKKLGQSAVLLLKVRGAHSANWKSSDNMGSDEEHLHGWILTNEKIEETEAAALVKSKIRGTLGVCIGKVSNNGWAYYIADHKEIIDYAWHGKSEKEGEEIPELRIESSRVRNLKLAHEGLRRARELQRMARDALFSTIDFDKEIYEKTKAAALDYIKSNERKEESQWNKVLRAIKRAIGRGMSFEDARAKFSKKYGYGKNFEGLLTRDFYEELREVAYIKRDLVQAARRRYTRQNADRIKDEHINAAYLCEKARMTEGAVGWFVGAF